MALVKALSNLTFTDNGDLTHKNAQDARLDMFYGMKESVGRQTARSLTEASWKVHPLDTLKLIFYILDVRHGKSCNLVALYALQWLFETHPDTLDKNLHHIAEFGRWKDYGDLLRLLRSTDDEISELRSLNRSNKHQEKTKRKPLTPQQRHELKKQKSKISQLHDAIGSKSRGTDPINLLTHSIARLFATQLCKDARYRTDDSSGPISLAAKWLPTKGSAMDRDTGLFDVVAYLVYDEFHPDAIHNTYRKNFQHKKQNFLRREVITPLRRQLQIVESRLSAKQVELIPYARVPSLAMKRHAKTFEKLDATRFETFLTEKPDQIKSSVLKPHEILSPLIGRGFPVGQSSMQYKVIQAQWDGLVAHIQKQGTLSNALAISDVSGSMRGLPMNNAVSLGLLIAAVAQPPWKDVVMTFSADPIFNQFDDDSTPSIASKVQKLLLADWGQNTAFDKVFDLILSRAVASKVPKEGMVKQLFVFSDMQFDEAGGDAYKTAHERIKAKFEEAGYDMPQLIYWNLECNTSSWVCPVTEDEQGTALVSGFSANILKLFLEGELDLGNEDLKEAKLKKMNPMDIMRKAIDDPRYDVLSL